MGLASLLSLCYGRVVLKEEDKGRGYIFMGERGRKNKEMKGVGDGKFFIGGGQFVLMETQDSLQAGLRMMTKAIDAFP